MGVNPVGSKILTWTIKNRYKNFGVVLGTGPND